MSDLADSVASLQRVVARPGAFVDFFPETTDDDLIGVLMDGMAEVQLDGMLLAHQLSDDGIVTPDLSRAQEALVIIYAGGRLIKAELFNRQTTVHYEASGAIYETTQATNILRDMMRALEERKKALRETAFIAGSASAFYMADAYVARTVGADYAFMP